MTPKQSALERIPAGIFCAQDYEHLAPLFMAHSTHEYIAGGSGKDLTVAANRAAFAKWAVYPRLLRDVTQGHTRLTLAGQALMHPIFLAPVAFQQLAHPLGELATARAAQLMQTGLICSTLASRGLEEVALEAGPKPWFQLYFQPNRAATSDLLRRAANAGYSAIVVTLDATIQAASMRALRADFQMPADCVAANLRDYVAAAPIQSESYQSRIFQGIMTTAPTWTELEWLMTQTRLPIWVKGILHPDDACSLQAMGIAGLVVSNHGGRSLDGAPASLQVLPAIRAAVGGQLPLLFDGGIRSGTDIFKAMALGANAVLIGRLQMYALSVAGALGVAHMLKMLQEELEVCMALAGCATLSDIGAGALVPC